jgi:hypothetical protein
VSLKFGLQIRTPTSKPGDDGWVPVMRTSEARLWFKTDEDLIAYLDRFTATNPHVPVRVEQVADDDPTRDI